MAASRTICSAERLGTVNPVTSATKKIASSNAQQTIALISRRWQLITVDSLRQLKLRVKRMDRLPARARRSRCASPGPLRTASPRLECGALVGEAEGPLGAVDHDRPTDIAITAPVDVLSVPDKDDGRTFDNALGVDEEQRDSYAKQLKAK
jgi:hypothetical protein